MKISEQIKPLSYLKSNAAEIIKEFDENETPLIITQNGEAKMVVMPIETYNESLETLAFLKIVAMGNEEIKAGKFEDANKWLDSLS
jgi:prevent-host-death family protein